MVLKCKYDRRNVDRPKRDISVFTSRHGIRSYRKLQFTPGTALDLASWLPQKVVVKTVEIQNYGGKRADFGLSEAPPNQRFEARRGPRRPCHRSLDLPFISMDDCANVTALKHPSSDSK